MTLGHSSDRTRTTDFVPTVTNAALPLQSTSSVALDPSAFHPCTGSTAPQHPKPSPSATTLAHLPRTSSLLPPRAAAAAATTPATLTPAYSPSDSPSEAPSFNADFPTRYEVLPETPPSEPEFETEPAFESAVSMIELPALSLPPITPLSALSDTFEGGRLSLEVLPGGEASDTDISGTSPAQAEPAAASDPLPKMSYNKIREPYGPTRGHSQSENGKSSVDWTRNRSTKPLSQKAMLSKALQKANTAVQLDNAQKFKGARQYYAEACDLLQHVLVKTAIDEDKKKLEAIRRTYDARIQELDQLAPWQAKNKELPAPPESRRPGERDHECSQAGTLEVRTAVSTEQSVREEFHSQPRRIRENNRHIFDSSQEVSRPVRLAPEQPSLHSAFSRSPQKLRLAEEYMRDNARALQPLATRRPSSPKKPHHERYDSDDRGTGTDSYHSGSWSGSRDGTGHFRDDSQNSWLDPIDEAGGSPTTSVHSQESSCIPGGPFRESSGNTEAEFDTALDAAIEAAYDEGYEPMDPHDHDTIDRTEEIVTNVLRKVEAARERVRQTEREAYPDEHQRQAAQHANKLKSGDLFDDSLSSDEEERILKEITREYNIEDFLLEKEDHQKPMISQRPTSRSKEAGGADIKADAPIPSTRSLAAAVDKPVLEHQNLQQQQQQQQQHQLSKNLLPSAPPPKQSLPELPLNRASSAGRSVRNRRLSGQNPKQLKIQTTQLRAPPATSYGELSLAKTDNPATSSTEAPVAERPQTSRSYRKLSPPIAEAPVHDTVAIGSRPNRRGQTDADDGYTGGPGSPTVGKLRKNFSSSSLRSLKGRNLSLSNLDESHDMSPGTPSSLHFSSARALAIPALPIPAVASLREQLDSESPSSFHLFEDNIHLPATPGSPNLMVLDPPAALEPCPSDIMLRPFWLMRCLYQTLTHPRGGYLSTKLFVPRDVWKVKGVKLRNVEDKISNCDLLTAALLKLATVDTCDADSMLDEMQALEGILEQVQNTLTRKLGSEVGVQGSGVLFREASNVVESDGGLAALRTGSISGKSSSFSWRWLRPKNSSIGLGGGYSSRLAGSDGNKETATMPTLPMTQQPTSRPPKRDMKQAQFTGPNANYMSSLARLFDAAQAIDQIARQVDDPGLRHADKTQVGLELSTRHAAEFFGFYVCRFALTDLGMLLDKFIKRGSEWVIA